LRLGHKSIDALISKIEVEMLADGASLNLCRYSDEPFNTDEIIWPHWGMARCVRLTHRGMRDQRGVGGVVPRFRRTGLRESLQRSKRRSRIPRRRFVFGLHR